MKSRTVLITGGAGYIGSHACLELLQADYKEYPSFIETGTLDGYTTFSVEPYFNTLYTIEFSEKYQYVSRKK